MRRVCDTFNPPFVGLLARPAVGRFTVRRRGSVNFVLAPCPGPPLGPHDQDYPHQSDRETQDGVVGVVGQQGHEGHDHNALESITGGPGGIARGPVSSRRGVEYSDGVN